MLACFGSSGLWKGLTRPLRSPTTKMTQLDTYGLWKGLLTRPLMSPATTNYKENKGCPQTAGVPLLVVLHDGVDEASSLASLLKV